MVLSFSKKVIRLVILKTTWTDTLKLGQTTTNHHNSGVVKIKFSKKKYGEVVLFVP